MEKEYEPIDFSALVFGGIISAEEALKDVIPLDLPDEVKNGTVQLVFSAPSVNA